MKHDAGGPGLAVPLTGGGAPDFTLSNQFGEPITLSELRGSPVILVFYPFAFSGICTHELSELQENLGLFESAGVRLLAISVDSKYSLRAYAQAQGFGFDLLADFWPHGSVAQLYGAFDPETGMAGRSTFVIDADGLLIDSFHTERGTPRSLSRYVEALKRLEH